MNPSIPAIAAAVLYVAAQAACAQQATNIRGTVTAFDGKTIAVATREGQAVEVALPETVSVAGTKARETIFIAARRDAEGKLTAARVQVSTQGVKPTQ